MKQVFFCVLLLSIVACNQSKKSVSYDYELVEESDKGLKYPIDDNTRFEFTVLYPYTDELGKEYLTFRSSSANAILFYDLPTGKYLFDVKLALEGRDGIGRMTGYYIENLDNIYLTSYQKIGLVKVDTSGVVKQFIPYGKTDRGYEVVPSFVSYPERSIVIHNGKIYITQQVYAAVKNKVSEFPVSVIIDTVAHSLTEQPLRFPPLLTKSESEKMLLGFDFSRCYDGKRLLYSFYMDENLHVTDMTNGEERIVSARSKYVEKLTFHKMTDDPEKNSMIFLNEISCYRNIIYDKYRDVYYRFVQLGAERISNKEIKATEIWRNGPARFSIIILDKNLNIIGETLFPEYTYNTKVTFVHKNGLYICNSHILSPDFDENILSFKCFTLKINK